MTRKTRRAFAEMGKTFDRDSEEEVPAGCSSETGATGEGHGRS